MSAAGAPDPVPRSAVTWTVFISSTFGDLKAHRSATAEALRNAGFHPVDMIHFMARPEGAVEACLDEVAGADLFIGIYAHRYGHVPENSEVGITEQEFEEARRLGKPCFCFVVDEAHPWPESEREGGENGRKLAAFKRRIDRTLVRSTFAAPEDLAVKVLASLKRWELKGVPRADSRPAPARIRPENEAILLRRVEEAWIDGVLKNALHHELAIQLEKEARPEAVAAMRELFADAVAVAGGGEPSPSQDVAEIFEASGCALLILGAPGSGKTVTLLELARSLIETAKIDPAAPVPVVLNLSSWSDRFPEMETWIAEELFQTYRIPRKVARTWTADVEGHPLVFLLDGLDEVTPTLHDSCAGALNDFRNSHGFSGVAVACREADYESIAEKLHLETAVRIRPLTTSKIRAYMDALGPDFAALKRALETDAALEELARTPLMLSVMTLAYPGDAENRLTADAEIGADARRERLFDDYAARMLRRRKSLFGYTDARTLGGLIWLAKHMTAQSLSVFHVENLQPSWLDPGAELAGYLALSRTALGATLLIQWVLFTTWLHSLSDHVPFETMVASFFGFMPLTLATICGLLAVDYPRLRIGAHNDRTASAGFMFWLKQAHWMALFVLVGPPAWKLWPKEHATLYFASIGGGWTLYMLKLILFFSLRRSKQPLHHDIQSVEGVRWSWRDFSGFFLITGLAPSVIETVFRDRDLDMLIYSWIIPSLLVSLFASLRFDGIEKKKTRPNQGIRMSLRNAMIIGPGIGGLFFLIFFISGPVTRMFSGYFLGALFFGLIVAGYAGLWYGGIDAIQHYSLRFILFVAGKAPIRYAAFLDDAARRLFLRKVGGGYIFIHRLLLEHFSGKTPQVREAEPGRPKKWIG
jgi:eukaryotic-like serine/threonine-protein kinase